jgi:hypothetical protein
MLDLPKHQAWWIKYFEDLPLKDLSNDCVQPRRGAQRSNVDCNPLLGFPGDEEDIVRSLQNVLIDCRTT